MYAPNLGDVLQVLNLAGVASRTSNLDGSAIDLKDYDGEAVIVLDSSAATAGSSPTLDVKLQESADGSTGWTDVTGGAFTQVTNAASKQKLSINTDECKRYIKAVGTLGGTSTPTFIYGVTALAAKQNPA
ncbi:MAG: hypothetical protein SFX19_10125 [Alphaproteobacteria bacterium]|nr:hypothetical protein [Alphaproteobacteria bacterium]